jgi:YD repeat-containing protein
MLHPDFKAHPDPLAMRHHSSLSPSVSGRGGPSLRGPQAAAERSSTGMRPFASQTPIVPSINGNTGTGINPWWGFVTDSAPGAGSSMLNVATGNLLAAANPDMSFANGALPVVFQRAYNTQSTHNVAGQDGGYPGMYGNGWTNTLDLHMMNGPNGDLSVVDGNGTRFDYTPNGSGGWLPPPGQFAQLTWDGDVGYFWTQKSGTVYYFWGPNAAASSAVLAPVAGRLYEIIGRNHNTFVALNYYTITGANIGYGGATSTSVIDHIILNTQTDVTATLQFATTNGYQLLATLTAPDGTVVSYHYDQYGDLVAVDHPSNGSTTGLANNVREEQYSWVPGTSWIYGWFSPRWISTSGAAGGYRGWDGYNANGSPGAGATAGTVNFVPSDGTGTYLQPSAPGGVVAFYLANYAYNSGSTQITDTDGHNTLFAYDSSGRTIQQSYEVDSALTLTSTNSWDANNDLISAVDVRGNETDAVYDANGNLVALAAPTTTTANGTFRPTKLYSFDGYNNVVAYCSAKGSSQLGENWGSLPPASSDSLCPTNNAAATQFQYSYPAYEPYGELQGVTTVGMPAAPSGYQYTLSYNPTQESGVDYGLTTSIVGTAFTQADGTTRQPSVQAWYDSAGRLACYNTGNGEWIATYDVMGRPLSVADPDDTAAGTGICAKAGGQPGWSTATITARNPDGSVSSQQTPSERAGNVSTTLAYDQDGDETSLISHYANTAGTTQNWYDGADRLVETALPTASGETLWATRYLYDLSQGAGISASGIALVGHGNLVQTQRYSPNGFTQAAGWLDVSMQSYDAINRPAVAFSFLLCPFVAGTTGAIYCAQRLAPTTYTYDAGNAQGRLTSVTDPIGEMTMYAYDPLGDVTGVQYSGDGGVTPAMSYVYNVDQHLKTATSSTLGSVTYGYDLAGNLDTKTEPPTLGAVDTYNNYPDGTEASLSVSSPTLSASPLFQFAYRNDGLLSRELVNYRAGASLGYTYTAAGRMLQRADVSTSASNVLQYDSYGRISSLAIPAGMYSGATYDDEGNMTGYSAYDGEQVGFSYDLRGELTGESFTPNPLTGGLETWPAFGVTSDTGTLVQDPSQEWDGRTGAVLGIGGYSYTYDAAGRMTGSPQGQTYSYDAANRLLTGESDLSYVPQNCGETGGRTLQTFSRQPPYLLHQYAYGPEGSVAQVNVAISGGGGETVNRHWDGGVPFYNETAGNLDGVQVGDDGFISGAWADTTGLNVTDRDPFANQTSSHNATGYSNWTPPNPYHQNCVAGTTIGGSSGYTMPSVPAGNVSYPSTGLMDDSFNAMQGNDAISPSTLTALAPSGGSAPYMVSGNNPAGSSLAEMRGPADDDCPQPKDSERTPAYCNYSTPAPQYQPINYPFPGPGAISPCPGVTLSASSRGPDDLCIIGNVHAHPHHPQPGGGGGGGGSGSPAQAKCAPADWFLSSHPSPKGSLAERAGMFFGGPAGVGVGVYAGFSLFGALVGEAGTAAAIANPFSLYGVGFATSAGVGSIPGYQLGTAGGQALGDSLFNAQYMTPTQVFGLPPCPE